MRRAALVLGCLALLAGSARADTFAVFPAELSTPPAAPQQLSYPQLQGLWQRAGAAYGVPWQVLGAINKVETNFGRNMGPSSAGAIGWMQFMPSTWERWGVDANGDGVADPWNAQDAVFSAARYLAASGGSTDLYRAVYAYNHADWYVREVLGLANLYGQDRTVAFSLDRLQQRLDAARRDAAAAGDALVRARLAERAAARVVARWSARANTAPLLSDRLAAEKQAALARGAQERAAAIVAARAHTLARARTTLTHAQGAAAAPSFTPAAAEVLQAPSSYDGGYVFPVGGGPETVSVSHTHHDYPAADIAAPEGAPLYALADSTVLRSWSQPDPRCGIGLTLRAFDGQVWTYCHMSYLDPAVVPGAQLSAGASVGLVGATGDATGPHLHLQLQPATAWPQQEGWFQHFAGSAFRWQDAETPAAPPAPAPVRFMASASHGPVFRVVPNDVVLFTSGT